MTSIGTAEERRSRIGASEIGAIIGADPYLTAYQLARLKLEIDEPSEGSLGAREMGHVQEGMIAEYYTRKTGRALMPGGEFIHPDHPWLVVHPDRVVEGGDRLLECKTSGILERWGDPGTSDVPLSAMAQSLIQAEVVNSCREEDTIRVVDVGAYTRVTVPPAFYHVMREGEDELVSSIMASVVAFRALLVAGKLPEPKTLDDLKVARPEAPSQDTFLDIEDAEEVRGMLTRYVSLSERGYTGSKEKDKIRDTIAKIILQNDATGLCNAKGTALVEYRHTAGRFDSKRFQREHPELYDEYRDDVGPRTFRITPEGKVYFLQHGPEPEA